jgi:hypothetical protein
MQVIDRAGNVVRDMRHTSRTAREILALARAEVRQAINDLRGSKRRPKPQRPVERTVGSARFDAHYLGSYEVGFVHAEAGSIYRQHLKSRTRAYFGDEVKPHGTERWVGVEIECATKLRHEDLAVKFAEADSGLSRYVRIRYDGSLRDSNNPVPDEFKSDMVTVEITVCAPRSSIESVLTKVTEVLSSVDAKVNRRCGLHVHLDQRNTEYTIIGQRYRRLVSAQHVLFAMQPKSRQDNRYCRKLTTRELERGASRYFGINGQAVFKHQTIEVRMHSGTTDVTKIMNWIGICESICYSDKEAPKRGLTRPESLAKYYGTDTRLVEYAVMRARKFKNDAEEAVEATAAGA